MYHPCFSVYIQFHAHYESLSTWGYVDNDLLLKDTSHYFLMIKAIVLIKVSICKLQVAMLSDWLTYDLRPGRKDHKTSQRTGRFR